MTKQMDLPSVQNPIKPSIKITSKYPNSKIGMLNKIIENKTHKKIYIKNSFVKSNPFLDKLMGLPHIHKYKLNTQRYKDTSNILTQLFQGIFFYKENLSLVEIDFDWMKKFNIPKRYLYNLWTEEEIFKSFVQISRMLSPGYFPENKKTLSNDVLILLYNCRSRTSQFLKYCCNEAFLLPSKKIVKVSPTIEKSIQILTCTVNEVVLDNVPLSTKNIEMLQRVSIKIQKYGINNPRLYTISGSSGGYLGLINDLCDWIKDNLTSKDLDSLDFLAPGCSLWNRYYKDRGYDEAIKLM
jgi:hypothetical protein